MKRFCRYLLTLFFASLAALVVAGCEPAARAQLEGILQNVDSISGEVTVKLKEGGTITFNLQDVNVETLRSAVGSASLETGSPVTVETDNDKKVKKIRTHNSEVEGIIKSLDKDKKTVTIASEEGEAVTLEVTETTKIEVEDGESATFADLGEGQEVEAKYDVETRKILKIEVEEEETKDEVKGAITAINKDAKTVTIRATNGIEATYKVTAATKLELDGVGTFDGLTTGMAVKAKFNRTDNKLIKLEVED